MFHIYMDGNSIYEPLDDELIINSPKLTLEMGKAGSLQFTVPPSHRYYDAFRQLKSIITVEIDDVEIFRGRVLTNNRNFNNIRTIYCEGILAYLVDSVQKGEKFEGTTHELFQRIIQRHNERVDADKQFQVGIIGIDDRSIILSGVSDGSQDTDEIDYNQVVVDSMVDDWQTSYDYIESCLIDYCGGYLRTRRVNNLNYIDLISDYGNTAVQEIEFGINLLDLTEEVSPDDICTVLIPLGDNNLTISEVNGGSDELIDQAGVDLYGRIVKTHVFDNVNQASTLLENAQRYMLNHINMPVTITVKAVDMHMVDKTIGGIYVGDRVHINSLPHGIVDYITCTKIEYNLENPSNDTYTFGNSKQTLTERYRKDKSEQSKRNGGAGAAGEEAAEESQKKLDEFFDAWINVNNETGHVDLGTLYQKFENSKTVLESSCGISLDAPSGNINIKALRNDFNELGNAISEQSAYIDMINNETKSEIDLITSRHNNLADLESVHYSTISQAVTDVESKIDLHTKYMDTLDKRVTTSENQITLLSNDVNSIISLESIHNEQLNGEISESKSRIEQISKQLSSQITLEASHKKDLDEAIASIQLTANNLGSAINLKADKTTINSRLTTINSDIITINGKISSLEAEQAKIDSLISKKIDASFVASKNITAGTILATGLNVVLGSMKYKNKEVATQEWVQNNFLRRLT